MHKFNPNNHKLLSFTEALAPAMLINDQAEAQNFLKDFGDFIQKYLRMELPKGCTAEDMAKIYIAYYASYQPTEESYDRTFKLFDCRNPTPNKAFIAGTLFTKLFYRF